MHENVVEIPKYEKTKKNAFNSIYFLLITSKILNSENSWGAKSFVMKYYLRCNSQEVFLA